jgi:hypothetical protein
VIVALFVVVFAQRFEPNPAYPEAARLIGTLDAAYNSVESGGVSIEDVGANGVHGTIVTLPEGLSLDVLFGEAGGECYVLMWGQGFPRRARVFAPGIPCEPTPAIASTNQNYFVRETPAWTWHFDWVAVDFNWNSLLPSAMRQRTWFLLAVILLSAGALSILVRASVASVDRR